MSDLRTTLFILRYRLAAFRRWLRAHGFELFVLVRHVGVVVAEVKHPFAAGHLGPATLFNEASVLPGIDTFEGCQLGLGVWAVAIVLNANRCKRANDRSSVTATRRQIGGSASRSVTLRTSPVGDPATHAGLPDGDRSAVFR